MDGKAESQNKVLEESQELFNLAPVPYGVLNSQGFIINANKALLRLLTPQGLPANFRELLDAASNEIFKYLIQRVNKSSLIQSEELKINWSGGPQWVLADLRRSEINPDFLLLMLTDISQRKAVDRHLREAMREKDLLLRELNHRVKNNLQMISSMISLQISQTMIPGTAQELGRIRDRVVSLSYLFDLLYGTWHPSKVDLKDLLRELVCYLAASFLPDQWQDKWSVEGVPIILEASKVLTCGQIVHELVTNVFKHSFPHLDEGYLKIVTSRSPTHWIVTIEDNGTFDRTLLESSKGLGTLLVKILIQQLDARLTLSGDSGTLWTLTAPF